MHTAKSQPNTMPGAINNIDSLKEDFFAAVKNVIGILTSDYGFSRERAVAVILGEISRGCSNRPSEDEIFSYMQSSDMGIEDAMRALTIKHSLETLVAAGNYNLHQAMDVVRSKLSVANLLKDPLEGGYTSEESESIRSDLRIETVGKRKAVPTRRRHRPEPKPAPKSKASRTSSTTAKGGRKRQLHEVHRQDSSSQPKRERADSVSEIVDSKLNSKNKEAKPLESSAVPSSQPNPRKTKLGSDAASGTPAKRLRMSSSNHAP